MVDNLEFSESRFRWAVKAGEAGRGLILLDDDVSKVRKLARSQEER